MTSIANDAFQYNDGITSVVIPEGVRAIGSSAFYACKQLKKITLPDSLLSIGESAFEECRSLKEITMLARVTEIGHEVFYACKNLEVITILCPYCEIDNCATTICFGYDESGKKPVFNGVIRGYDDSTAEDYAYINDYRFDSLGKAPETEPLLLLCIAIRLSEKS